MASSIMQTALCSSTMPPSHSHAGDGSVLRTGACPPQPLLRSLSSVCHSIQTGVGPVESSAPTSPPPSPPSVAPPPPPLLLQGVDINTMNMMMMRLVEGGLVFRETLVVRSYEIGADKAASLETFLKHFQESALNHVRMSGLLGDGFGATHGMVRNHLIWVVSKMQVEVEKYPLWGDVIELDTWVCASGKNGMRRDWLVRDYKSGEILARATSTWVMMNGRTRRLSKIPDEVRAEISPWFIDRCAIKEASSSEKINKVADDAIYINSDLKPQRKDLDMNQHVNNVKYVGWMLETVPTSIQECYELQGITLEYRKECGQNDVVQALTSIDHKHDNGDKSISSLVSRIGTTQTEPIDQEVSYPALLPLSKPGYLNMTNIGLDFVNVNKDLCSLRQQLGYVHLLRLQHDGAEIVRAQTKWRTKVSKSS
ncbi:hypothetical protein GOP47_0028591 [Adiantum capillus-veneris]|nr:hypothetical protein GOP47_0028591 [Adiantum capillus-veneris]